MCSARSQRPTVEAEMREAIRLVFARSANAWQDQRESGFPHALGSVQASAVICARTAEGKKARGSRAFPVLDGPVGAPTLTPVAHGSGRTSHESGDAFVGPVWMVMGGHQDFRADDLDVGRIPKPRDGNQFGIVGSFQIDLVHRLGSARHRGSSSLWTQRTKRFSWTQKPGTNL